MSALEHTIIVASIYLAALLVATGRTLALVVILVVYVIAILVLVGRLGEPS